MTTNRAGYACYLCRRQPPPEAARCDVCGAHLDSGSIDELHFIDALLERILEWERQGQIDPAVAPALLAQQRARKSELLRGLRSGPPRPTRTPLEKLVTLLHILAHRRSPSGVRAPQTDRPVGEPPLSSPAHATPARNPSPTADRPSAESSAAARTRSVAGRWNRRRTLSDRLLSLAMQRYDLILYGLGALLLLLSAPVIATQQWNSLPGAVRFVLAKLSAAELALAGSLLGLGYWLLAGACERVWPAYAGTQAAEGHRPLSGLVQSLYDLAFLLAILSLLGTAYALWSRPTAPYVLWALIGNGCLVAVVSLSYRAAWLAGGGFAGGLAAVSLLLYAYGAHRSLYALAVAACSLGLALWAYGMTAGWRIPVSHRRGCGRIDLALADRARALWIRGLACLSMGFIVLALGGASLTENRPVASIALILLAAAGYFLSRTLSSPRYLYVTLLTITMLIHGLVARHYRPDPVIYLIWTPTILINAWFVLGHLLHRFHRRISAWEGRDGRTVAQVVYDFATLYLTLPFLAAAFQLKTGHYAYTLLLITLAHLLWTRKNGAVRYLKIPAVALVITSCYRLAFASQGLGTILLTTGAFVFLAGILRSPRWLYPGLLALNGGLYSLYGKNLSYPYSTWVLMGGAYFWWGVGYWLKRFGASQPARGGFLGNPLSPPFFNAAYALAAFVLSIALLPLMTSLMPDFRPDRLISLIPYAAFFLLQVKTHNDRTWLYGFLLLITAPLLIGASIRFPMDPTSLIYLLGLVNIWLLAYNLIRKHRSGFCRTLGLRTDEYELPFYHCALAVLLIVLVEFFYDITIQVTDPLDLRLVTLALAVVATVFLVLTFLHLVLLRPSEFFINCLLFTLITGVFWQSQLIYFQVIGPGFYYPALEFSILAALFLLALYRVQKGAVSQLYGLRGRIQLTAAQKGAFERMIYYWIMVLALSSIVLSGISSTQKYPNHSNAKVNVQEIVKKNIREMLNQPAATGGGLRINGPDPWPQTKRVVPRPTVVAALWLTTLVLTLLFGLRPTRFAICGAWIAALYSGYALLLYMSMKLSPGVFPSAILSYFGLWTSLLSYAAVILPRFARLAVLNQFPTLSRVSDAFRHMALIECLIPIITLTPLDPINHGAIIMAGVLMVLQALIRAYDTQRVAKVYFAVVTAGGLLAYLHFQLNWFQLTAGAWAIAVLGLSLLALIGEEVLRRARLSIYVGPLRGLAVTLPLLSLAVAFQNPGSLVIGIGLAASAFYGLLYDQGQRPRAPLIYLAGLLFNVSVFLLWINLGISALQAYLFIPALTALALVNRHKRHLPRAVRHWLRSGVLAAVYTAALWPVAQEGGPLYNWAFGLNCLAGMMAGYGLRVRAYLFTGLLFLAFDILIQIVQLWRNDEVYLMAWIGLGLIASAALLGRRHERIALRWKELTSQWE